MRASTADRILGSMTSEPPIAALPDASGAHPRLAWLRSPAVRLLLTSATILFVELLLIRWIPSQVRYVGFFSNFLLMASFLGIGVGILLGRRGARWSLVAFPLLLLLLMAIVITNTLNVEIVSQQELFFGLAEHSADTRYEVLILVVALVTVVLAALAMPLGPLLRSMPPLRAYAIDIGGSMVGIVGFTVLSAAGTDPVVWFTVAAVLTGLLVLGANVHGRLPWTLVDPDLGRDPGRGGHRGGRHGHRQERDVVALLPHHHPPGRQQRDVDLRQRHPAPGDAPDHGAQGGVLRPGLPLVPGPDV